MNREPQPRKDLEKNARLSEERFRTLVENSADAILLSTEDGTILFANQAASEMFGLSEADICRLDCHAFLDPGDPEAQAALEERHRTGRWIGELKMLRADGTAFPAEVSSIVFTDSAGTRLVSTSVRDVSRRKQAEEDLVHRHELMRYIIEHVRSAVAVMDRDLRYIYVSQRFLHDVNAQEADVIGKRHYDVFPEIPESWRDVHRRALAGEVIRAEVDPFKRADGTVYWTRWECRPWYEADASIGGIILYTEVINDQIKAEEDRRRLQAQLAQAQKMESIGRHAGGVAHDFNNLLTVINGYADIVLRQLNPDNPLREDLEEIRKAGARAAALTLQLLAFSRKQALAPRLLDLNQVVREIEPMLRRLMGESVRVRVTTHPHQLPVLADHHQLEQVVMNLAVNARDAMPEGGSLTIETGNTELDGHGAKLQLGAKPGPYAVLVVTDTGSGMDQETLQRIFEPFFTTKQAGRGTGLGLSMVDGIIAQSGGFITVTSELGRGASFRIHLPYVEGAPGSPVDEAEISASAGRETVLVVEDQIEVLKYATEALKAYGYSVLSCGAAAEALALCEQPEQRVDLVLTDMVMPEMGGRELAERLAELRPNLPVLFMSGYTGGTKHDDGRPGEERFLQKPFSPAELARKVKTALGGQRGRPD